MYQGVQLSVRGTGTEYLVGISYLIGFLMDKADGAAKKFLCATTVSVLTIKHPFQHHSILATIKDLVVFTLEVLSRFHLRGFPGRPSFYGALTRSFATMASTTNASGAKSAKLHGRAFYESIGSPKYIVAPMVDQSEFVCFLSSPTSQSREILPPFWTNGMRQSSNYRHGDY